MVERSRDEGRAMWLSYCYGRRSMGGLRRSDVPPIHGGGELYLKRRKMERWELGKMRLERRWRLVMERAPGVDEQGGGFDGEGGPR